MLVHAIAATCLLMWTAAFVVLIYDAIQLGKELKQMRQFTNAEPVYSGSQKHRDAFQDGVRDAKANKLPMQRHPFFNAYCAGYEATRKQEIENPHSLETARAIKDAFEAPF